MTDDLQVPEAPEARRARLVLGDDHQLMVEAMRSALAARHDVVAVAHTADEILAAVRDHQPDLLLLDLSLPGRNGLELIPDLRRISPGTRIIVVTMHLDRVIAESALTAGADGFVPKDAGLEELERAIGRVLDGGEYVSHRVPTSSNRVSIKAAHAALSQLTPRQHEIVKLIAAGLTSVEIGRRLGLSERTVAFHRTNIRQKLGVDSERGLIRYSILVQLDAGENPPGGGP